MKWFVLIECSVSAEDTLFMDQTPFALLLKAATVLRLKVDLMMIQLYRPEAGEPS